MVSSEKMNHIHINSKETQGCDRCYNSIERKKITHSNDEKEHELSHEDFCREASSSCSSGLISMVKSHNNSLEFEDSQALLLLAGTTRSQTTVDAAGSDEGNDFEICGSKSTGLPAARSSPLRIDAFDIEIKSTNVLWSGKKEECSSVEDATPCAGEFAAFAHVSHVQGVPIRDPQDDPNVEKIRFRRAADPLASDSPRPSTATPFETQITPLQEGFMVEDHQDSHAVCDMAPGVFPDLKKADEGEFPTVIRHPTTTTTNDASLTLVSKSSANLSMSLSVSHNTLTFPAVPIIHSLENLPRGDALEHLVEPPFPSSLQGRGGGRGHHETNRAHMNLSEASNIQTNMRMSSARSSASASLRSIRSSRHVYRPLGAPQLSLKEILPEMPSRCLIARDRLYVPTESRKSLGNGAYGDVVQGKLYPPGFSAPKVLPSVENMLLCSSTDLSRWGEGEGTMGMSTAQRRNLGLGNAAPSMEMSATPVPSTTPQEASTHIHPADRSPNVQLPLYQQPYGRTTAGFYNGEASTQSEELGGMCRIYHLEGDHLFRAVPPFVEDLGGEEGGTRLPVDGESSGGEADDARDLRRWVSLRRAPTPSTIGSSVDGGGRRFPSNPPSADRKAARWRAARAESNSSLCSQTSRTNSCAKEPPPGGVVVPLIQPRTPSSRAGEALEHGDYTVSPASAIPHVNPSFFDVKTPSTASAAVAAGPEDGPLLPFRTVAVKRVYKAELCRTQVLHALKNEVLLGSQLCHPCLLNVFGVTEDSDCVYLVMDLAENGNLAGYLAHHGVEHTRGMAARLLADVVLALEHLGDGRRHVYGKLASTLSSARPLSERWVEKGDEGGPSSASKRDSHPTSAEAADEKDPNEEEQLWKDSIIQHRDLKPENLLLTWDYHVKIADFGSSCFLGNLDANRFGGSPAYISPEVIIKNKASPYSDLWALGCVLYELTQGVSPFKCNTAFCTTQKIKKFQAGTLSFPLEISPEAKDLIERLLQPNPSDRIGAVEQGGFEALKRHPFFKEICWDSVLRMTNLTPDNTDYTAELTGHLFANENVVYCTPVEPLEALSFPPLFAEDHSGCLCLFVLTDLPRLVLVVPCQASSFTIPWSSELRVEVETGEFFSTWAPPLTQPLRLRDLAGRAEEWRLKTRELMLRTSPVSATTATTHIHEPACERPPILPTPRQKGHVHKRKLLSQICLSWSCRRNFAMHHFLSSDIPMTPL